MRAVLAAVAAILVSATAAWAAEDCHIGAYRFADGTVIDVAPSEGDTLRWRNFDGTTGALHRQVDGGWTSTLGWTGKPDGHQVALPDCASGTVVFDGRTAERIAFDATETMLRVATA